MYSILFSRGTQYFQFLGCLSKVPYTYRNIPNIHIVFYPLFQKLEMIAYYPASCVFLLVVYGTHSVSFYSFLMLFNRFLYLLVCVWSNILLYGVTYPCSCTIKLLLTFCCYKSCNEYPCMYVCNVAHVQVCKYPCFPRPHSMFPNLDFLQSDSV